MNFLFINTQELTALMDLPLIQRVAYLMAIKPYMDRQTSIVGIKRRISYQSIREILYVAPIAGVKTGSPSIQQVRRAVKSLERAGLISIHSTDQNLILKCILAETNKSALNKADSPPTSKTDICNMPVTPYCTSNFDVTRNQADITQSQQADTPHNSVNNIIFLKQQFEKFWSVYPLRQNKQKAWGVFLKLNPSHTLFEQIIMNLQNQVAHYQQLEQSSHWVPNWKYPANWIAQECWKEELITIMEKKNASYQNHHGKKSDIDLFWESCKDGADYAFGNEPSERSADNIITFPTDGR